MFEQSYRDDVGHREAHLANDLLIPPAVHRARCRRLLQFLVCIVFALIPFQGLAQSGFTKADTLRGSLSRERSCYDVRFYELDLRVDPDKQWISGSNRIHFDVKEETKRLQIDLFPELQINSVRDGSGKKLRFSREGHAVFVDWSSRLKAGEKAVMEISYQGNPKVAVNPPWDGGVSWGKDVRGEPWVVVTCQNLGASVWWPNKDHQTEEPDSMRIAITVPPGLMNVSNGRLRDTTALADGWVRFDWFVSNPINNYSVTMNIGRYVHFQDWYVGADGDSLSLDYYVMPENLDKARAQFLQVQPMLACFEEHFGPYPFPEDGFKLVESPHPGMEHQSAIAYGNHFENGYRGHFGSEEAKWFDFIIIHETAHEWFGNSLTAKDIADMWIHESFGTYMEAVYVECLYGYDAASRYMEGKKEEVLLDRPVVGAYGVQQEGSRDMYPKGALMLHTLRQVVGNDRKWWDALRKLAVSYRHRHLDYEELTRFLSIELGADYSPFFRQYLKEVALPVLHLRWKGKGETGRLEYRWETNSPRFELPVRITLDGEKRMLYATENWKALSMRKEARPQIASDPNWYIELLYD